MSAPESLLVRAARALPVPRTPVWFMRQAGRYMPEYREIRRQHSLLEICKTPELAAEVTITAAEALGVDAAIIFADLLLPLEVLGIPFRFAAGEGPVIERPVRDAKHVAALTTKNSGDLQYVAESVRRVAEHFDDRLPVIGFCGAPFTLASYIVEGGGSRHYVETKKMMYRSPELWRELLTKLVDVLADYGMAQIRAGADVFQVFDSWVGCLSREDYCCYVLPHTKQLIARLRQAGAPVIYFGTDTATLLPAMQETSAEVIGIDWRIPLDEAWFALGYRGGIQGNLDPAILLADWKDIRVRAELVLKQAARRPGHIFNLGHGILPGTPVQSVKDLASFVQDYSSAQKAEAS